MASPVSTAVKYFRNDMPSAPVIHGAAGSGVAALRAMLVTGFGLRSVTSAVVQGGFARLTLAAEPLQVNMLYTVIQVDGATPSDLNGEQRVMYASATELRFPTALPDGPVAGSITIKSASAGWEELFIGSVSNKAAFRRLDPQATVFTLLVDDTLGANIGVRGVLSASSVTAGTSPFPDTTNPAYWLKSGSASANAVNWDFFADSRAFYFSPYQSTFVGGSYPTSRVASHYFFGDPIPTRFSDPNACVIIGKLNATASNEPHFGTALNYSVTSTASCWAKSWIGTGTPPRAYLGTEGSSASSFSGDDPTRGTFPNPCDGTLYTARAMVSENAHSGSNAINRAYMPGVLHIPHDGVDAYIQPRSDPVILQSGEPAVVLGMGTSWSMLACPAVALMSFLNGWR